MSSNTLNIWVTNTTNALQSGRYGHTMLSKDKSLYIIGGMHDDANNEIWLSDNTGGIEWRIISSSPIWSKTLGHTIISVNGLFILLGGVNLTSQELGPTQYTSQPYSFVSQNIINWEQTTKSIDFTESRAFHTSVFLNDEQRILMIGGAFISILSGSTLSTSASHKNILVSNIIGDINDLKNITWNIRLENAPWGARSGHTTVVLQNTNILIIGGTIDDTNFQNDIWSSSDGGRTWTRIVDHAEWPPRRFHTTNILNDGSIYLIGGESKTGHLNDVWVSKNNGLNWSEFISIPTSRSNHSAVVLNNKIFFSCGRNQNGILNDVLTLTSLKFSTTINSSPFSINTNTQPTFSKLPNNTLTIDIHIPGELQIYMATLGIKFIIKLIRNDITVNTFETNQSTISFPFNDFNNPNWKVNTSILITGQLLEQETSFTFTNFPILTPTNIIASIEDITDTSFTYVVDFDYDISTNTTYPVPTTFKIKPDNTDDYTIIPIINGNHYTLKYIFNKNHIDYLNNKTGSLILDDIPTSYTFNQSILFAPINPRFSYSYVTIPSIQVNIDISFDYPNIVFGIDSVVYQIEDNSTHLTDGEYNNTSIFEIPNISIPIDKTYYNKQLTIKITLRRFGIESEDDYPCTYISVPEVPNFKMNITNIWTDSRNIISLSAIEPPDFTNSEFKIFDENTLIGTKDTTTSSFDFSFNDSTYFGKPIRGQIILYVINKDVSNSITNTTQPFIPLKTPNSISSIQSFINNTIEFTIEINEPTYTNDISVNYIIYNSNIIYVIESTTLAGINPYTFINNISEEVSENYGKLYDASFNLFKSGTPREERFQTTFKTRTEPIMPPLKPDQLFANERFDGTHTIIDLSFISTETFTKVRLQIDASNVLNVYNDYPNFIKINDLYDLSAKISKEYFGRNIDISLILINVNETLLSSESITKRLSQIQRPALPSSPSGTQTFIIDNHTQLQFNTTGYTPSDYMKYVIYKYDKDLNKLELFSNSTAVKYNPEIIYDFNVESKYVSETYGFNYLLELRVRLNETPDEERFYSDVLSINTTPAITSVDISDIFISEIFVNNTIFDISFEFVSTPNFTYADISLCDIGNILLLENRYTFDDFTITNNIAFLSIFLLGDNYFGKSLTLKYRFIHLNEPYNSKINTRPIPEKESFKIDSYDISTNYTRDNILFNVLMKADRKLINGDIIILKTLEFTESLTFPTNIESVGEYYKILYTVGTPSSSHYGTTFVTTLQFIPSLYPNNNTWRSELQKTISTSQYEIAHITDVSFTYDVIVNSKTIQFFSFIKFNMLPSLEQIKLTSLQLPQQRVSKISNDFIFNTQIKVNNIVIESYTVDGDKYTLLPNDYYQSPAKILDISNYGKQFEVDISYSLLNTSLVTYGEGKISALPDLNMPTGLFISKNYIFGTNPIYKIDLSFTYSDYDLSPDFTLVHLSIFNTTKNKNVINEILPISNFTKNDTIYNLDSSIETLAEYYNDNLDVSCLIQEYDRYSKPFNISFQSTSLNTPSELTSTAILNYTVEPSDALEISNTTFSHNGAGKPPFASVSFEIFNIQKNKHIINGSYSYSDLKSSGIGEETVSYYFPNSIKIDAPDNYLDKLRLTIQLIYETVRSESISYEDFINSSNPDKPVIKAAKYNPALEHIHITFNETTTSDIWHFSNVILYNTSGLKVFEGLYKLDGYESIITQNILYKINDDLYVLDISLSLIDDEETKTNISSGSSEKIDICLNIITDVVRTSIYLKASEYDSLTDDLKFEVGFKNLAIIDTSLQYHDFNITYDVEPPEEQQFISEYVLYSYSSNTDNDPVDSSFTQWKTIENNNQELIYFLIGTENKLIPDYYYWFKIIGKHGTSLSSELSDSSMVRITVPPNVLDLSFATFDFGHEIRKNILDVDVSFTLDITPVRENMNIILDISGSNNQVKPTEIYENDVLVPFVFPAELPNLSPKIYIYNDWKQSISVSAKYKNVVLKTLNYIEETPITLEDISASAFRNGLYKTTYVIQWKKIDIEASIEIYSYIVENVVLSYEEAVAIPLSEYSILEVVSSFKNSFSFNQPRMREIPTQTQVIRFRAIYNPESELSEPIVLYQTNCGYPSVLNEKKQILSKGGFTKKELYAKGFRGRLF